jgi:hypothetical protein
VRRRLVALPICCLALSACGSDTLNTDKGERLIRAEIEKVTGVHGVTITCPDDVEAKTGGEFTCQARAADGTREPVAVRQKDEKGNVHFEAPLLHTGESETAIVGVIAGTKPGVTVDCPDLVVPVKGRTMRCVASASDGTKADVTVRFNGNGGRFNVIAVKER